MTDCSWVLWFKELVGKVANNDHAYLIENAKAVDWGKDVADVALLKHGDENVDPLSFLYFLAQKNTTQQFKRIYPSVHEKFDIQAALPEPKTQLMIPTPPALASALFFDPKDLRAHQPALLWRLFRQAARDRPEIAADDFERVLDIRGVGTKKLTQTLFLVNPDFFLPADHTSKALGFPEDIERTYQSYFDRIEALKRRLPGCYPCEINCFLWEQQSKEGLITRPPHFFCVDTDVYGDGLDYWQRTEESRVDQSDRNGWTFKEDSLVWTASDGSGEFPLTDPERGDIILVRHCNRQSHAIGVVTENKYSPQGWAEDRFIAVIWINRVSAEIDFNDGLPTFGRADENLVAAYRNIEGYKVTFNLIDQLSGSTQSKSSSRPEAVESPVPDHAAVGVSTNTVGLNTILFGPPGTGKTWESTAHAVAIVDDEDPSELVGTEQRERTKARFAELREEGRIEFVTFHQNYAYEDFVEGIRPVLNKTGELAYKLHEGIFKRLACRADKDRNQRHVLVIDEINRGNIAKIFGELITLIEPSKRLGNEDETLVMLPYSQESFGVPCNLYVIGTMNTADRGIALLDTALRRRFEFVEKMPDPAYAHDAIEGVNGQELLKAINRRIKAKLDREHQIGHTYFIGVTTLDELADVFQRQILPLLQEYFYEDWKNIRDVLNSNPFVTEEKADVPDADTEQVVFEVLAPLDRKWHQVESYRRIYEARGDV